MAKVEKPEARTASRSTKRRATPSATMSVREVAEELSVGLNQAYSACERGEIPSIRIGGRILVPRAAFERMLEGP